MKAISKAATTAALSFSLLTAGAGAALSGQQATYQDPRIDVAFLIDTTGSMSNLIQGAKVKIWSIAKEMLSARVTPDLRMALVAYRDRGDRYVTQVSGLTNDIDSIYGELLTFQAGGGGDRPESVNQALDDAINRLDWDPDPGVYRVVFLVGDSPPKMQYADDVKYDVTARLASRRDIVINTVLAGGAQDTGRIWREIARLAHGRYSEIPQDGGMQIIETPYDQDIQQLSGRLNETALPYGSRRMKEDIEAKLDRALSAPASTLADKQAYHLEKGVASELVTGSGELITDLEEGRVSLDELESDSLPLALQGKAKAEQEAIISAKRAERGEIKDRLDRLLRQRDDYLKSERAKASGGGDAFDREVEAIIREQGAAKGLVY